MQFCTELNKWLYENSTWGEMKPELHWLHVTSGAIQNSSRISRILDEKTKAGGGR